MNPRPWPPRTTRCGQGLGIFRDVTSPPATGSPQFAGKIPDGALVAVGGACGAVTRWALGLVIAPHIWAIFTANIVGAFVLGYLAAKTVRHRHPTYAARVKVLWGTGFCGALTTFSTLISDTHGLNDSGPMTSGSWLVGQLVVGLLAASLGSALAARTHFSQSQGASGNAR